MSPEAAPQHIHAIWWDFVNEGWACRLKCEGGGARRITRCVRHRMQPGRDLALLSFEEAKAVVHEEVAQMKAVSDKREG